MAGGLSSDGSYDKSPSKQIRLTKKVKKKIVNNSINISVSGKYAKEKPYLESKALNIPQLLCECQQKCTDRVSPPLIQKVCMYFNALPNRERQFDYLSKNILIKLKGINAKPTNGKPQKMGFRYFVPILTDVDINKQISEKNILETIGNDIKMKPDKNKNNIGLLFNSKQEEFPEWDHIEVCLKAFTAIHIVSEKRVTVTRANRKLLTEIKCSKPFSVYLPSYSNNVGETKHEPPKKKLKHQDSNETNKKCDSTDISYLVSEWLTKQALEEQTSSFAINPKTLLPEGLVFPASVICLPLFSIDKLKTQTSEKKRDHEDDVRLVDSFFSDQLWKPEYIGSVP